MIECVLLMVTNAIVYMQQAKVFGGVFVLSRCFLDFSVGVGAFVIGLYQISSFFSSIVGERLTPYQAAQHPFLAAELPIGFLLPESKGMF